MSNNTDRLNAQEAALRDVLQKQIRRGRWLPEDEELNLRRVLQKQEGGE